MLTRLRAIRSADDNDAGLTLADVLVGSTLAGIAGAIGITMFVVVSQQAAQTTTKETLGTDSRNAIAQIASEIEFADSPTAVPVSPDGRFEVFQQDKITFYSNRDSSSRSDSLSRTPPSKVTIARVADTTTPGKSKLVMTLWNPTVKYGIAGKPYPSPYDYTANYPTEPSQTLVLAQGIGNTSKSNEALFTYCSAAPDPEPTTAPAASTPTPGATPPAECGTLIPTGVAVTDRATATRISSVIIRLKVGGETFNSNDANYQPATWLTTRVAISGKVTSDAPVSAP